MSDTPQAEVIEAGRPLKFERVDELQQKINEFFAECDPHISTHKVKITGADGGKFTWKDEEYITEQQPYTITGLALHLDTTRDTLLDYESGRYDNKNLDEATRQSFSDTIKKAKLKIHAYAEGRLFAGQMVAGVIFNLKNNFNWVDRKELTGKDGEPLAISPADAAALHNAIGEIKDGNKSGSGATPEAVSGPAEPSGV